VSCVIIDRTLRWFGLWSTGRRHISSSSVAL